MDWTVTLEQLISSHILLGTKFMICGDSKSIRKLRIKNSLQIPMAILTDIEFPFSLDYDDEFDLDCI